MGYAEPIQFVQGLEATECCSCGVAFAMPAHMLSKHREKGTSFYCPNGHSLSFTKSEVDKLREELSRKDVALESARKAAEFQRTLKDEAERRVSAQKGITTKLQKRIASGICPCCKRTVSQLAAHMKSKHPGFPRDDQ